MYFVRMLFFYTSLTGRILGDVNLNLDDKAAMKARELWEDWHLWHIIDHPTRTNHVSGKNKPFITTNLTSIHGNLLQSCPPHHLCTNQVWRWHPEQVI